MKLYFTKMHGCGNDYIYINSLENPISNPNDLSIKLSNRNFGIGSDGIILICPSNIADAKMRIFNADGSEGKMCGNGIRCVGKYLYDNKIVTKNPLSIETLSGIKILNLTLQNNKVETVTVDMGKASLNTYDIPAIFNKEQIINEPIIIDNTAYHITCVSMGNPHCVIFTQNLDSLDLSKLGPKFENNPIFPERINTEFIEVIDSKTIKMRVWERGSGETLACGTGACAATVASVLNNYCDKNSDVTVKLKGGTLSIKYTDEAVYLTGPSTTVFTGEIDI